MCDPLFDLYPVAPKPLAIAFRTSNISVRSPAAKELVRGVLQRALMCYLIIIS